MKSWGWLEREVAAPPYEQRTPIVGERRLVATGVILSALLLAFGLARVLLFHETAEAMAPEAGTIVRGLLAFHGDAALLAGLLVLALTPLARLGWILWHFWRRSDKTMVVVTSGVLALVVLGIVLGALSR